VPRPPGSFRWRYEHWEDGYENKHSTALIMSTYWYCIDQSRISPPKNSKQISPKIKTFEYHDKYYVYEMSLHDGDNCLVNKTFAAFMLGSKPRGPRYFLNASESSCLFWTMVQMTSNDLPISHGILLFIGHFFMEKIIMRPSGYCISSHMALGNTCDWDPCLGSLRFSV